jgi:flagellar biogenesis protein FliO
MKTGAFAAAALAAGLWVAGAAWGQSSAMPAASAPIPFRTDPTSLADLSWRVGLALVACTAVAVVVLVWIRRRFPALAVDAAEGRLRVIDTRRLDTRRSLVVVRWGGDELLLGLSESGLNLLAQRPAVSPPSDRPGAAG